MSKRTQMDECTLAGMVIVVLTLLSPLWVPFWIVGRLTRRWWND